jgi:L-malate glycosyltransferase
MTENTRPHVVHVIDELPPDGAERLIVDVLQNRSQRFRYSVLCIVAGGEMQRELEAIGVPVTVLGRRRGIDPGTVPALMRWYRRNDVAVVHTHLFAADSYGRVAAWLARVPGRFSTRHNVDSWKGRARKAIARTLSRLSTRVIACGEQVGRSMIEREGLPADRVVVIPNGVNLRRFDAADRTAFRRELGLADDHLLIGVLGRLHPQKGHLDLLAALEPLGETHPRFTCALVGSGELREQLAAEIERRGLARRVLLIGQRRDVPDILAALDLLVMPSRWEGLPMALLEGMALRKPVLATRVGAIPDVIENGVNGLLVDAADPRELRAALERLMTDPALRDALGDAARATVAERFNAAHTAAAYEALYAGALGLESAGTAGLPAVAGQPFPRP